MRMLDWQSKQAMHDFYALIRAVERTEALVVAATSPDCEWGAASVVASDYTKERLREIEVAFRNGRFSLMDRASFQDHMRLLQEDATGAGVVYMLVRDGRIIYVGETENIATRLCAHDVHVDKQGWQWCIFGRCATSDRRRALEALLIHVLSKLEPLANRRGYDFGSPESIRRHARTITRGAVA